MLFEGRLKLDTWEKDGQKHSKLKVICERMQMLGGRGGQARGGGDRPAGASRPAQRGSGGASQAYNESGPPDYVDDAPPAELSGGGGGDNMKLVGCG